MKKKLLLIEPPFYRLYKQTMSLHNYPLSLGYLGSTVKNATDWSVMTYSADFSRETEVPELSYLTGEGYRNYIENLRSPSGQVWTEVRQTIEAFAPDVVGISAKSANFASVQLVARIAKDSATKPIVIVGGPHPSMVGQNVLRIPEIDIAVRGEGERTLVELLVALQHDSSLRNIRGIVYREAGQAVETEPRELIGDLDELPFPSSSAAEILKDYQFYPADAFSFVFTSRGCPFNCFFCGSRSIWSRKVRQRSTANVLGEIDRLWRLGVKKLYFADDTFGVKRERTIDFCERLGTAFPQLRWSCELHVNVVQEQLLSAMKRAGCELIQLGVESGSDEILRQMRKGYTIDKALAVTRLIKEHGIRLATFFMVGFPQETEESFHETARAIAMSASDEICYSIFTPYPGTEAFEYCREHGLVDDTFDVSRYNHKSPENHFCSAISKPRLRQLCAELEQIIDRLHRRNRFRRVFALQSFSKVRTLGLAESLRRLRHLIAGPA
jgi:tRNA A37 methylthiotransferase MiaB